MVHCRLAAAHVTFDGLIVACGTWVGGIRAAFLESQQEENKIKMSRKTTLLITLNGFSSSPLLVGTVSSKTPNTAMILSPTL